MTTNPTSDVIVVGAGVIGSATAWHLARRGARVRLIDQFELGHKMGSSHGPSRIIRLAYETADYVKLAHAAYTRWRELEAEVGRMLMVRAGGFDFGAPDAFGLREIGDNYAALGIAFDALDAAEIRYRFPQFNPPEDSIGFYQADYSLLAADDCVRAMAEQAVAHGAHLNQNETVIGVEPTVNGVRVATSANTYEADRVVLCAGSWMLPILQTLGINVQLQVSREQVVFMAVKNPAEYSLGRFPLALQRYANSRSLGSAFPIFNHTAPKFMVDRIGTPVAPEDPDRPINQDQLDITVDWAKQLMNGLTGDIVEVVSCRYTMTPDEDFILGTHPQYTQIVLASPCSGHGFKFASVIGDILTDLALTGNTAHDIGRFKHDRAGLAVNAL
jgi:sarcosine oxidase